jgi:phage tail sheath protein FI
MPQYLAPGVYIEEVPGARPIEPVGTATAAFVGVAERGPLGTAVLVTNPTQFTDAFGSFIANGYLAYAVRHFFDEGGTRAYVVRTCHYTMLANPLSFEATTATATLLDRATPAARNTLRAAASSPGSWGDNVALLVEDAKKDSANKFRITVLYKGLAVELYEELTVEGALTAINPNSKYIQLVDLASTTTGADRRPAASARRFNDLAVTALAKGLTLDIAVPGTTAGTFRLVVRQAGTLVETLDNLTMADVARRVNGVSRFVLVNDNPSGTAPTATAAPASLSFFTLAGGWDGLAGTALVDRAAAPVARCG